MANERAGEEGVCHAGEATLLAVQGHPRVPEVEAAHHKAGHVLEAVRVMAPVLGGRVTVAAELRLDTRPREAAATLAGAWGRP